MAYLAFAIDYVRAFMLQLYSWLQAVFDSIDGFEGLVLLGFAMFLSFRFFLVPIVGAMGVGSSSDFVRRSARSDRAGKRKAAKQKSSGKTAKGE